jgi:site-specific DNA recombinase
MSANKGGPSQCLRFRYYQTKPDAEGGMAWRVTSSDIEPLVVGRLATFLEDQQAIIGMVEGRDVTAINATLSSALGVAAKLRSTAVCECRAIIETIVQRIDLAHDTFAIRINGTGLRAQLGQSEPQHYDFDFQDIVLDCPVQKIRRGHALRLILPPSAPTALPAQRDDKLVHLVAEAASQSWSGCRALLPTS